MAHSPSPALTPTKYTLTSDASLNTFYLGLSISLFNPHVSKSEHILGSTRLSGYKPSALNTALPIYVVSTKYVNLINTFSMQSYRNIRYKMTCSNVYVMSLHMDDTYSYIHTYILFKKIKPPDVGYANLTN